MDFSVQFTQCMIHHCFRRAGCSVPTRPGLYSAFYRPPPLSCKHYTTVGWDFSNTAAPFFVDHTHCCKNKSDVIQRALATAPRPGHSLEMSVWVDSGMIEAFSSGVAITALVYPNVDAGGLPEARRSAVINTADGVSCQASSYQLALNGST